MTEWWTAAVLAAVACQPRHRRRPSNPPHRRHLPFVKAASWSRARALWRKRPREKHSPTEIAVYERLMRWAPAALASWGGGDEEEAGWEGRKGRTAAERMRDASSGCPRSSFPVESRMVCCSLLTEMVVASVVQPAKAHEQQEVLAAVALGIVMLRSSVAG